MNYFLDNDVAIKIAQYQLMDEFLTLYTRKTSHLFVLGTLKYRTHIADEKKSVNFLGSNEARDGLIELLSNSDEAEISDQEKSNELLSLNIRNLDAGELILFYLVSQTESARMMTGDKRAVKAAFKCDVLHSLESKVIILEQAIHQMVEHFGHKVISNKVRALKGVDCAIEACFGVSSASTYENTVAGLDSYINDLKKSCPLIA